MAIDCGGVRKAQCSRHGNHGTDNENAPLKEALQGRKDELKANAQVKQRSEAKVVR